MDQESTPSTPTERPARSGAARLVRASILVNEGEWPALLLSVAYFFLLLLSYFMLRPVRDAMGIARGTDDLPWLMSATLIAMLAVNPLYWWLVARMPRRTFIPAAYRVFGASLVIFYLLWMCMPEQRTRIGHVFFVWLSVLNLLVVSIFWSFMADMFRTDQAKRLFGFVAVGGTLGAVCGAYATGRLVGGFELGSWPIKVEPISMLLIAIVPLELAVQCVKRLSRLTGSATVADAVVRLPPREPGPGIWQGIQLIAGSRYLMMIASYVMIYAITLTILYLEVNKAIERTYPDPAARTEAFADLDFWSQIATLLLQVFVTSRVIRSVGVGTTLAILPAVTLLGFAAMLLHPAVWVVFLFRVVRHSTHHAFDKPAREILFTRLGADEKYKSKAFIDTFIYRTGDQLGAWLPKWIAAVELAVYVLAIPLAIVWMVLGVALGLGVRKPGTASKSNLESTGRTEAGEPVTIRHGSSYSG